jgi:U3 small nucleolar ribonucleoprotein protein LCP5
MADGISLLLLRPQLLMSSLQQLIILTAMRLSGVDVDGIEPEYPSLDEDGDAEKDRQDIADSAEAAKELCGELALDNEIFDKIRGLESKLEYQIKKLVGLADASANAAANAEAAVEEGASFLRSTGLQWSYMRCMCDG